MAEMKSNGNGFAITALVVGIVAFLFGWTGVFGLVLAIVAVVFAIVALTKKQSKGMAITGLVLGGIALLTALFVTLFAVALFGGAAQVANDVNNAQQKLDAQKKDFAKGETAVFHDLEVKVVTYTPNWQSGNQFDTAKEGYQYQFVKLNIKNKSKETVSVNPYDFQLNDNGVVSDYVIASPPQQLKAVELKPGAAIDGDLVFEAKAGATGLVLQYKTYDSDALKDVTYSVKL
jgi:hypothetical protein